MLKKHSNDVDLTKQTNSMTIVDEYRSQPTLKLVEIIRQALPIPKILTPTSRTNYKTYYLTATHFQIDTVVNDYWK